MKMENCCEDCIHCDITDCPGISERERKINKRRHTMIVDPKYLKKVTCPECGRSFYIEKYRRRPAKNKIHQSCLNPLGITISKS